MLRLYTYQHIDALNVLKSEGAIIIRDEQVKFNESDMNYSFINQSMAERTTGYMGGNPLWFWAHPTPTQRLDRCMAAGKSVVCVECLIPRERVLLSDFNTWSIVIQNGIIQPLDISEEETYLAYDTYTDTQRQETWEHIFDLRFWSPTPPVEEGVRLTVQACVKVLFSTDIISHRIITPKGRTVSKTVTTTA